MYVVTNRTVIFNFFVFENTGMSSSVTVKVKITLFKDGWMLNYV